MKRIKPLLISIFMVISFSQSAFPEDHESLIDLNEILTQEDVLWDQEIQEYLENYKSEDYTFTTNRAFEDIKQAMLGSLEENWAERLDKPDGKERKKAVLVNPNYRGTQIWLTHHSKRDFMGKRFLATISVITLPVIDIERSK